MRIRLRFVGWQGQGFILLLRLFLQPIIDFHKRFETHYSFFEKCEWLFLNAPLKSVWYFDQRFSSVQFIQDPSELRNDDPQWIAYFPANRPESTAINLFSLDAGKSYLIEMEQDSTWTITGKPAFIQQTWNPNSYNLAGFYVDP